MCQLSYVQGTNASLLYTKLEKCTLKGPFSAKHQKYCPVSYDGCWRLEVLNLWVDIFYKKYRSTFLKRVLFKKHGPGSNGSRQVLQKPTSTAIGESNLGNSQIRNSKIQFVEKTSTRFSVEKARCLVDQEEEKVGGRNRKGSRKGRNRKGRNQS